MITHAPDETKSCPQMLALYLILYDFLIDDDEDVRDSAAAAVSNLKPSTEPRSGTEVAQIPLMVPAAQHQLLKFLEVHYHASPALWVESIQRLTGLSSEQARHGYPSPSALLEDMIQEDTTLFVEEKQNLYVDECQEAAIWQNVLLGMDRAIIDADMLRKVHAWTLDSVDALTLTACSRLGGPLGWTSKPDVFTSGVRTILAAEALIRLADDKTLSIDIDGLQHRLRRLLLIGTDCWLHPTWLRMIRCALDNVKSTD